MIPSGESKAALRKTARLHRAAAAAAAPDAAHALARHAAALVRQAAPSVVGAPVVVGAYAPIGDEMDPTPLLETLPPGVVRALPVIGPEKRLTFRAWGPGTELRPGIWGIRTPTDAAPAVIPDLLLVPLLAFDRKGYRLGYGGGYYDATLAALRAGGKLVAIGLAYAAQEIESLPVDAWDQRLDFVATERDIRSFGQQEN